ncbi:MAG: hypothetical protein ACEPOZ_19955 [Marinifilaceae bacterium]
MQKFHVMIDGHVEDAFRYTIHFQIRNQLIVVLNAAIKLVAIGNLSLQFAEILRWSLLPHFDIDLLLHVNVVGDLVVFASLQSFLF